MLPPILKLAIPPLQVEADSRTLRALAWGFAVDFADLVDRLGDVRAVLVPGPSEGSAGGSEGRDALEAEDFAAVVASCRPGAVLLGRFAESGDGFRVALHLHEPRGEGRWRAEATLRDGAVQEARLQLAADLIEACTGGRKDVRHARRGSTDSFAAYKRACLAAHAGLPRERRVRLLREAVERDPDYADARLRLADLLGRDGRPDEALAVLREASERFPRYSWGRLRYGVALSVAGALPEAIVEVQAALDSDPDGRTLFHAGLFAEANGDPATAEALHERAVDRGCTEPVLFEKLAALRANAGAHEEAAALYERALDLDPSLTYLLGGLALAHHFAGRSEEAEQLFARALEERPDVFSTHANRAVWLQDLRRHADAAKAFTRAMEIREGSALLHNNRGVSRLALGDRRGARADFEAALALSPSPELATYARANLARLARGSTRVTQAANLVREGAALLEEGDARNAIPLLLEAVDLHPDRYEAWMWLALAYRLRRRWEPAADALAEALRIRPDLAEAHSERALVLLALDRRPEALDHARLACNLDARRPAFLANLALVHMEGGEWTEARELLATARELEPGNETLRVLHKELRKRLRKDPRWGDTWIDDSIDASQV